MGFIKIGGRWVSKDGDQAGPSGTNDGEEPEAATNQEEHATETHEVGPSDDHIGERMTSMSPFERLMVNRMDTFAENQRNLHDCVNQGFTIWIQGSKPWLSRLKKFITNFWIYNMAGMIEGS